LLFNGISDSIKYRNKILFSNKYGNGTVFSGTLVKGILDQKQPFKFVYHEDMGSYERKQGEEPTCTLFTGQAKLKNGWFQTGITDDYDDYYFVNEKSGDLYRGDEEPDQNG